MLILKKIMNYFIQKEQLNLNLKNFSFLDVDNSNNKVSDVRLYKNILTSNEFLNEHENIKMLKVYLTSKRIVNLLNLFLRTYKWKKAIEYDVHSDLFLNDLDEFPKHQKITLLENNTTYKFRLSDLVNYWVTCLTNSQNLFSRPLKLKNPHTNIEISHHNLINIYIKLLHTNFNIPLCVHAFYLSNMCIGDFSYKYYGILKEKTIENFIFNGSYYEKYEQVINLLHDYRKELNYTTVLNNIPYLEKKSLIYNLRLIIPLYIRGKFSCNPLVKRDYSEVTKKKIKEFFDKNPNLGIHENFVTRYVPISERRILTTPPPAPPEALTQRRPTIPPPLPPSQIPPLPPIQRPSRPLLEVINEIDLSSNSIIREITEDENNTNSMEVAQETQQENREEIEESIEELIQEDIVESIQEDIVEVSEEDIYDISDSSESIDISLETDSLYDEDPYIERENPFRPRNELNRTPPTSLSRRQRQISSSFSIFR